MVLENILFTIVGYLTGGITIFLIFFRNINKLSIITSQHDIRIEYNKENCGQAVSTNNKILDEVKALVNQNNILIQAKIVGAKE